MREKSQRIGQRVNRRGFLATSAVTATMSLAGCLGGEDDYIRYLGWGGNTQDAAAEIFERWSEESGVEVRHESAGGDVEMISYIQQNQGEVDLVLLTSYGLHLGREDDLLTDVEYDEVPHYEENLKEDWQDMPYIEGDAFFRDALTQGFSVNTEEVNREMTSWDDIKDDEFDDYLSLRDDAASRFTNAALSIGEDVNETPEDDDLFDRLVEELEAQHENAFGLWDAGAEAMQYLREENAMVAEAWGGRTRALQQEGYEHVEYVIPEEGAATITEDYAIPAASEKEDTVYDLLDFAYEYDNLVDISDMLGYPVPVVDTPDVITDLPDYVDDPDDLAWVDWSVVDPVIDDWQETFDEIK